MGPANSAEKHGYMSDDDSIKEIMVTIHKGLEGESLDIPVKPQMPFASIMQSLLLQMTADPTLSAILSSEGNKIETTEDLLECHSQGACIFATLVLSVQKMALRQVVEELMMPESEFRGHRHVLSRYPKGITYKDVANYLFKNKVLLTPTQASGLFQQLLPKLVEVQAERQVCLRAQLIMALHTFCLEPYAIWEADDGQDECVWYGMMYSGNNLGTNGRFCLPGQRALHFPDPSPSSSANSKQDVSNLRGVLQARRENSQQQFLEALVPPTSYDFSAMPSKPRPRWAA
eukprot:s411_g20.t1